MPTQDQNLWGMSDAYERYMGRWSRRAYFTKVMTMCSGVMQGIVNCPKPVIAEVTGIATAAGCQLAASCDQSGATGVRARQV